jgi:hypothetical protein
MLLSASLLVNLVRLIARLAILVRGQANVRRSGWQSLRLLWPHNLLLPYLGLESRTSLSV